MSLDPVKPDGRRKRRKYVGKYIESTPIYHESNLSRLTPRQQMFRLKCQDALKSGNVELAILKCYTPSFYQPIKPRRRKKKSYFIIPVECSSYFKMNEILYRSYEKWLLYSNFILRFLKEGAWMDNYSPEKHLVFISSKSHPENNIRLKTQIREGVGKIKRAKLNEHETGGDNNFKIQNSKIKLVNLSSDNNFSQKEGKKTENFIFKRKNKHRISVKNLIAAANIDAISKYLLDVKISHDCSISMLAKALLTRIANLKRRNKCIRTGIFGMGCDFEAIEIRQKNCWCRY